MLGYAGLPNEMDAFLQERNFGFIEVMIIYVVLMLFLGTILHTASIILIVVPLFITLIETMGMPIVSIKVINKGTTIKIIEAVCRIVPRNSISTT